MVISYAPCPIAATSRQIGPYGLEVLSYLPSEFALDLDLILLHGAGHSAKSWRLWARDLAADRRIRTHALSLRGHSNSGLPPQQRSIRAVTINDFVDDLRVFFDAMGIDPARSVIAAHSLGGTSAQIFAQRQRVGGLALIGTVATNLMYPASMRLYSLVPFAMPRSFFYNASALFATLPRVKKLLVAQDAAPGIAEMLLAELQPEISFARNLKWIRPHRFRPALTDHVLVLAGDKDVIFTPYWIRKTAVLYGVEPVFITDGPHDLMWAGDPARLAGMHALADFCGQVAGPAGDPIDLK